MFGLGMGELLVILVIVLLIFGASKLPQIGDSLGKSIRNFKSAMRPGEDPNAIQNAIEVRKKKEITAGTKATKDADDADEAADAHEEEVEVAARAKPSKKS